MGCFLWASNFDLKLNGMDLPKTFILFPLIFVPGVWNVRTTYRKLCT